MFPSMYNHVLLAGESRYIHCGGTVKIQKGYCGVLEITNHLARQGVILLTKIVPSEFETALHVLVKNTGEENVIIEKYEQVFHLFVFKNRLDKMRYTAPPPCPPGQDEFWDGSDLSETDELFDRLSICPLEPRAPPPSPM